LGEAGVEELLATTIAAAVLMKAVTPVKFEQHCATAGIPPEIRVSFHFHLRLALPFNFLHSVVLLIPSALQTTSRSPLQEANAARISSASM
jgi:hypothetical protein